MTIRFEPGNLRKLKAWELLVRFVFGGVVTVAAGFVSKNWGAFVGGICLAFPAILPASLTLVKEHDGRSQAAEDARGARLGAAALLAFAGTLILLGRRIPPWAALSLSTFAWSVTAGLLFWVDTSFRRT